MRQASVFFIWILLFVFLDSNGQDQKHFKDLTPGGEVFFNTLVSDIQHKRLAFEDSALPLLHKSVDYFKESEDSCGVSKSFAAIARTFFQLGLRDSATLNFHLASEYLPRKTECDYFDLYYLYNSWGIFNYHNEDYNDADSLYEKALKAAKQLEDRLPELNVYINQANLLSEKGEYDAAIKKAKSIFVIASALQLKDQQEKSLQNIAAYFIDRKMYDSALIYVNNLNKLLTDESSIDLVMDMHNNKGLIYQAMGRLDSAKKEIEIAVDLATENDLINKKEGYLMNLAAVNFALQNYDESWALMNEYVKVFKQLNDKRKQQEIEENFRAAKYQEAILVEQNEKKREKLKGNIILLVLSIVLIILIAVYSRLQYIRKSKRIVEREKKRSDDLLRNILPDEVAEELKEKGHSDARSFEEVTVLFTDFKDFTNLSEKLSATALVEEINYFFKHFDEIVLKHGIEKIKTIGDSFMAAGGVPTSKSGDVKATVNAALEMIDVVNTRNAQSRKEGKPTFEMRIGINTGPVVAGIVGIKKFQYDIWGDTVNTASRMESSCEIGRVNISESTYEILKSDPDFTFEDRGSLTVKGKGKLRMYFVNHAK